MKKYLKIPSTFDNVIFLVNRSRIVSIIIILFASISVYSNSTFYYFYNKEQIAYNIKHNRHEKYSYIKLDYEKREFSICESEDSGDLCICLLKFEGSFSADKNILKCKVKKTGQVFSFKCFSINQLLVVQSSRLLKTGQKLYLAKIEDNNESEIFTAFYEEAELIYSDYWKTGVKNGFNLWLSKDINKLVYFAKNKPIDSLFFDSYKDERLVEFKRKYSFPSTGAGL